MSTITPDITATLSKTESPVITVGSVETNGKHYTLTESHIIIATCLTLEIIDFEYCGIVVKIYHAFTLLK